MKTSPFLRWTIVIITLVTILYPACPLQAKIQVRLPTDLTEKFPKQPLHPLTGSQFAELTAAIDEQRREEMIEEQVLSGNIPDFLRHLKPVVLQHTTAAGRTVSATIFVTPDYLAIGSENDFLRTPMDYHTASRVAARFGCILPTRKMVDAIYNQSEDHFRPQPMQAGPLMRSTDYYQRHNQQIQQQQLARGITSGELVSGHKKDVVISNRLINRPERIAIYGWHRSSGDPIQPLSTVHGAGYADYSHGIRLVSETVIVDGKLCSVYDILKDPDLSSLLSDEGPIDIEYNQKNSILVASRQKIQRLAPAKIKFH